MVIFVCTDCFIGMYELCMAYVFIILSLMLIPDFDSLTACATALCGSAIGFTSALANPSTTIIGQKVVGFPLLSGWQFRPTFMIVAGAIDIVFVMRYAYKVQMSPQSSIVYESDLVLQGKLNSQDSSEYKLTFRQKLAGIVSPYTFIIMIVDMFSWGWDMPEVGDIFTGMEILSGLISGIKFNEICDTFLEGYSQILLDVLIVGLSRGVPAIMNNVMITNTTIHVLTLAPQNLPSGIIAIDILTVQATLDFLISSGSR